MKKLKNLQNLLLAFLLTGILVTGMSMKNDPGKPAHFYTIGHRGTRGLMPENTIEAMKKAIDLGCNTIEVDIHITKDGKVVVYHDYSFNPEYTLLPDGSAFTKEDRKQYTFYQMNYADIRKFIIGKKKYDAFPQQQQMSCYAPLLTELIDSVEHYTKIKHISAVNYLVEIKSDPATDGFEQPVPEVLVDKMMEVLLPEKLGDRLIVQSFDVRPLKVLHQKYPDIKLGFLTGDKKISLAENLDRMGFTPEFYNPYYEMVTQELVDSCHEKGMAIAPWTVNQPEDMKKLKKLNVDGIITDYPNFFSTKLK